MKGVIWKYLPKIDDPDLKDEMGRAGCRVLNPDPDFWEHEFPVWAICGPRVRVGLEIGDILFFTPTRSRCEAAGVAGYLCTGLLTVGEIVPNGTALLRDPRFTDRYKRNYRVDLKMHLVDDETTTARQRGRNIALGDPRKSAWFGRHGVPMSQALRRARIGDVRMSSRRVRDLTAKEAERLWRTLSE